VRGIRKIETGRTNTPRPATVRLLADAFGLAGTERDRFLQNGFGQNNFGAAGDLPRGTNAPALVRLPVGVAGPSSPGEPGLVGRAREAAVLDSAAQAAKGGLFRIVWIGGEAGAGKSTLATALTSELARRGWNTAWVPVRRSMAHLPPGPGPTSSAS
jgi:hypothetical protein